MVRYFLITLIAIVIFFSNCTNEVEQFEIDIQYQLLDDVSPLNVLFQTEDDYHGGEWTIDSITCRSESNNSLKFGFENEGFSEVKFKAKGSRGEEYFGSVNVEIPKIADRLSFFGYYFKEEYQFDIEDDSLKLEFNYNDGEEYTFFYRMISKLDFNTKDSIRFINPINIDFPDLREACTKEAYIYFVIRGASTHQTYFKCNFYINDWYNHHRHYAPNYIYINNILGEKRERIFFHSDWTN